ARGAARADGERRRLLRDEGQRLPRIPGAAARGAAAGPAGEVDGHALRKLPFGQPRARPRRGGGAGAGRGGAFPRGPDHRLREPRRVPEQRDHAAPHGQHGEERGRRVPHAAGGGLDALRLHQHHAGGRLPRRGAARGQLLHGAAGRHRGAGDGDRPGGAAPAQPHPGGPDPVPGAVRHALRQRRLPRRPGGGAGRSRLGRLRGAAGREPRARQAARDRDRPVPRGDGAALQGDGRHPLRRGRRRDRPDRHAGLRAGARLALRPGAGGPARHPLRPDPALAGRQRPAGRGRRHRRVALDHGERDGALGGQRAGDRKGEGAGGACVGGVGGGHRVLRRALRHRGDGPRDRHPRPRGAGARDAGAAGRPAPHARRVPHRPVRRLRLPQRLPRRRGGDRSRHGRDGRGGLRHRQRLRRAGEPDAGGGPGARRHRAGHRPGADGADRLRRGRPAPQRFLHGLRPTARGPRPLLRLREPPRSRAHQRAGREGLRRGGVRGRAAVRDERGRGCAGGARRGARRHARDAAEGLGPAERGRRGI
ncbi:MAG: Carbon monoxide dehydrogenase large chain, partial [uncultured Craurococcus sp.]